MCLLILAVPARAVGDGCRAERVDARVRVDYVYDGDTVRLDDGRRVRLAGVNTPEIGRDGRPDDPLAVRARQALRELVEGRSVGLRYGRDPEDRYGRLLAHLYGFDGSNITAELLRRGLGAAITIPPNTGHLRCYRESEAQARAAGRGIWRLERYRPLPSEQVTKAHRGFYRVSGPVVRVGESRSAIWLNLPGNVAIRVPRERLDYFEKYDPRRLLGRRVEARGWLYERNGEARMTVHHPADLTLSDEG